MEKNVVCDKGTQKNCVLFQFIQHSWMQPRNVNCHTRYIIRSISYTFTPLLTAQLKNVYFFLVFFTYRNISFFCVLLPLTQWQTIVHRSHMQATIVNNQSANNSFSYNNSNTNRQLNSNFCHFDGYGIDILLYTITIPKTTTSKRFILRFFCVCFRSFSVGLILFFLMLLASSMWVDTE